LDQDWVILRTTVTPNEHLLWTAVQATSVGSSVGTGSHVQLRPASRARLPLRLAPDVNVPMPLAGRKPFKVGGRKIAHNLH
jgi:hypothetical protein